MTLKRKAKPKPKRERLVGTWTDADEYYSDVEFTITRSCGSYAVRVCSGFDGEVLSFAAHWNSTGRFVRYRLRLVSANRTDVTYTYTETEMYLRKRTKRKA